MTRSALAAGASCLLMILFAPRASAECVEADTPCRDYARHAIVFQARVERITPLGRPGAFAPNLIHVVVERAWKGITAATVDLFEGDELDGDYHGYKVGERYLVYANPDRATGRPRAFSCGRTKPLSAAKWDLEFLESLSRPAAGGRLFGMVARFEDERQDYSAFSGVLFFLERAGVRRQTRSGPDGRFEFTGLQPGTYSLTLVLPAGYLIRQAYSVLEVSRSSPTVRVEIEGARDCTRATFILTR